MEEDLVALGATIFLREEEDKILMDYFDWETSCAKGDVEQKEILNREWN